MKFNMSLVRDTPAVHVYYTFKVEHVLELIDTHFSITAEVQRNIHNCIYSMKCQRLVCLPCFCTCYRRRS